MTYQDIDNLQLSDLYGALVNAGADAGLIETEDVAQGIYDYITTDGVNGTQILPEDETDFEQYCKQLDLDPEDGNVKSIWRFNAYNQQAIIICFAEDWQ